MRRPHPKWNALSWCRHGRANWKHGRKSAETMAQRKEAAAIRREIRRLIALVLSA